MEETRKSMKELVAEFEASKEGQLILAAEEILIKLKGKDAILDMAKKYAMDLENDATAIDEAFMSNDKNKAEEIADHLYNLIRGAIRLNSILHRQIPEE